MSETIEKVEFNREMEYETFIKEKDLDIKKFPTSIGVKIRTIKMLVGKYKSEPSETRKSQIITADIKCAELIADWMEQNFPDDFIDPTPTSDEFEGEGNSPTSTEETPAETKETPDATEETPAATEETPAATEETPAATEETPAATEETPASTEETPASTEETPPAESTEEKPPSDDVPPSSSFSEDEIEEMEKKIMDNLEGNRIKASILTEIIGTTPQSPEQRVGKLLLRIVFLNNKMYELK